MPHPTDEHEPPNWFKAKVSNWFWRLTPTCREVVRLTSEERDRPLPIGLRLRLRLHRIFCKWCARYARQLDLLSEASHLYPEHLDSAERPALDGDAKARLKRAIRERVQEES
jgi:hypothetical protein